MHHNWNQTSTCSFSLLNCCLLFWCLKKKLSQKLGWGLWGKKGSGRRVGEANEWLRSYIHYYSLLPRLKQVLAYHSKVYTEICLLAAHKIKMLTLFYIHACMCRSTHTHTHLYPCTHTHTQDHKTNPIPGIQTAVDSLRVARGGDKATRTLGHCHLQTNKQ